MTLETCKRLLKHYQDTGNKSAEADMQEHMIERARLTAERLKKR